MVSLINQIQTRTIDGLDYDSDGEGRELVPKLPPANLWESDLNLGILYNSIWQPRRVVYTKEVIAFARVDDESEIKVDEIPLAEVSSVQDAEMAGQHLPQGSLEAAENQQLFQNAIIIHTIPGGYNSGRTYYLKANSGQECAKIMADLSTYSYAARKRAESKSKFTNLQRRVRHVYNSRVFQGLAISCIILSFGTSVIQMQTIRNYTGQPKSLQSFNWDMVNFGFTIIFAIELGMNALGHWFRPFIRSGWNLVDVIVVLLSLASLSQNYLNVNVVRMLRAVRIVRLFGKVEALKRVVAALTASVVPMANAFIIMFIVTSIYAVMGVIMFGEEDGAEFGVFDRAFITLFQITCGMTWVQYIPMIEENGTTNGTLAVYIISFVILINWVILQVTVAILLESFVTVSSRMEREEERLAQEARKRIERRDSPLDPLFERLARKYIGDEDLSLRIKALFQVLDGDGSGRLSSKELCEALKKLDFKPPIHMSDSDFVSLTANRTMCDADGCIGLEAFDRIMRQQLTAYSQALLSGIAEQRSDDDFVLYNTLKHLVLQQHLLNRDLSALHAVLATVTAPAPQADGLLELKPQPSVAPESKRSDSVAGTAVAQRRGDVLREESQDWLAAVETAVERAMGGVLRGLRAVQCAVTDLAEARDADRRALEAAAAAASAASAAAAGGSAEVDGLVAALREAIWHCRQLLAQRRELDLLSAALTDNSKVAGGSIRREMLSSSAAAGGMETANIPNLWPGTGKQSESAEMGNSSRLRTWASCTSLTLDAASLSGGPARQLAASLASAATASAVEDKRGSGTRKRGGDAADGGRRSSTPAQQRMPRGNPLLLSAEEGTAGTPQARRRGAAIDGGGHGAGSAVFAASESLAKQVTRNWLERASRRYDRHPVEKAQVNAPLTVSIPSDGTGLLSSVAARGGYAPTVAGTTSLGNMRGQPILAVPMLPAAGSEVVWARRA